MPEVRECQLSTRDDGETDMGPASAGGSKFGSFTNFIFRNISI